MKKTDYTLKAYCNGELIVNTMIPAFTVNQESIVKSPLDSFFLKGDFQKGKLCDPEFYMEIYPIRISKINSERIVNSHRELILIICTKEMYFKIKPAELNVVKSYKNGKVDMYFKMHAKDFEVFKKTEPC